MSTILQHRRGTTAQHSTFTGASGEITVDTTKNVAVVHDGSTAGGFPLAPASVAQSAVNALRGLVGAPNSGTPLTKYDLSADAVTLRNAAGATLTRYSTGTTTCDFGLAGSAANGRDQAAAFTANSWVYLYFIWNGTTLATLASTTAPAAFNGSTLPSGYTYWAFATALRWNGSSNIVPVYARGSRVWYDISEGGVNRALTSGVATSMTAVSLASLVPPNALFAHLEVEVNANTTVLGPYYASIRPTGATNAGQRVAVAPALVSGGLTTGKASYSVVPGTSQQIDYSISAAPTSSGGVTIDVNGYSIPNGDSQ